MRLLAIQPLCWVQTFQAQCILVQQPIIGYKYIQQYILNRDFHFEAYMTMNKIQLSEY